MAGTETKMEDAISLGDNNESKDNPEIFKMKSTDKDGNNCVVYQDPEEEVVPLVVRVGLTLYDTGTFDIEAATIPVVFDLWLVYDYEIYLKTFGSTRENLPWTMPNSLGLDITNEGSYMMYGTDLMKLNQWTKRQKIDPSDGEIKKFRVETFSARGTMKLTTFPSEDPFQSIYLVFKLAMDGTPGSEMTQYVEGKGLPFYISPFMSP